MGQLHAKSMIALLLKRPHFRKGNFTHGLFLFAVLTAAFLIYDIAITLTTSTPIYERIILHTILLILSSALFIAYFWRESSGDFFSFINIILMEYFVMFVVPIFILLYVRDVRTKPAYWEFSYFEYSIWIVIISLYSLAVGYRIARMSRTGITFSLAARPSLNKMGIVLIICIAFIVVYYLVKPYLMGISIWDFVKYYTRSSEVAKREYGMGIYTIIEFFNRGASYIFLLCFILPRDKNVKKGLILCANLFILIYVLNALVIGFRMTTKVRVFEVVLVLCTFIHYTKHRIGFAKIISLFITGLAVLTIFNYHRIPAKFHPKSETLTHTVARMYTQTFEDFETLCAVTSHFPRVQQYYCGRRLFEETFYLPIPRALWKGKPDAYGFRGILYDIEPWFYYSGYHTGLQSQFYADFGLAGVIIGFIVFGWAIGWIYNTFRRNMLNKGIVLLYALFLLNSMLFLKGGFPWINLWIMIFIPFYIVIRYIYPYPAKAAASEERILCGSQ